MTETIALPIEVEQTRKCRACGKAKPIGSYSRKGNYRVRTCRECRAEARRDEHQRRPKATPETRRRWKLMEKYGITVEQYDAMFSAQGGVCAICGGSQPDGKRLAVDHCHQSGRVRALLCQPCNFSIGRFEAFRSTAEQFLTTYGRGNPVVYDDLG